METAGAEVLVARDLRRAFGRLSVLDGISFAVKHGELVCMLGPSGCGKTTILRMLAGLLPADSGSVLIGGTDIAKNREPIKNVSVVFQEPRLLPWRTVRENVRLSLELRRNGRGQNDVTAVGEALELVGLSDFGNSYPHELSGGMKQRVSLARALVTEPEIMLMDEPLTGLDLRSREELQDEIIRIWSRKKITLTLVTHDPAEAIHLADRVIVLSSRPTHMRDIVSIGIPRPRPRDSEAVRTLEKRIRGLFGEELPHETPQR